MNRTGGAASVGLAAVIAVMVCSRVSAEDVAAGMRACARETDDTVRLQCYDREMRRDPPASPSAVTRAQAGSANPPEPAAVPEMTPEQAFGFRGAIARDEVDRRTEKRDTLERLEAVVEKVEQKPLGEFVMTLANGQVWAQKAPDTRIRLKAGDTVTIRRASLGSFMMTAPNGRSTQVARMK